MLERIELFLPSTIYLASSYLNWQPSNMKTKTFLITAKHFQEHNNYKKTWGDFFILHIKGEHRIFTLTCCWMSLVWFVWLQFGHDVITCSLVNCCPNPHMIIGHWQVTITKPGCRWWKIKREYAIFPEV